MKPLTKKESKELKAIAYQLDININPTKSSRILGWAFNSKGLWIIYKGYRVYLYHINDRELVQSLDAARSKGVWIQNNLIKANIPYEEVKL